MHSTIVPDFHSEINYFDHLKTLKKYSILDTSHTRAVCLESPNCGSPSRTNPVPLEEEKKTTLQLDCDLLRLLFLSGELNIFPGIFNPKLKL